MSALTASLAVPAVQAQCVLCYLSANATGERGTSVLRIGILVLLIPTLLIFGAVLMLLLRRREPAALAPEEIAPAQNADRDGVSPDASP